MRYDFSQVEDRVSFASVPPGVYTCRVAEVRPGVARDGSERWSVRLEVIEGEFAGRTAAWDNMTWSEKGVVRVKRVLEALGFDVEGELEVEAEELLERRARVQVMIEEWEDSTSGQRRERCAVPYQGWGPADASGDGAEAGQRSAAGEESLADHPF